MLRLRLWLRLTISLLRLLLWCGLLIHVQNASPGIYQLLSQFGILLLLNGLFLFFVIGSKKVNLLLRNFALLLLVNLILIELDWILYKLVWGRRLLHLWEVGETREVSLCSIVTVVPLLLLFLLWLWLSAAFAKVAEVVKLWFLHWLFAFGHWGLALTIQAPVWLLVIFLLPISILTIIIKLNKNIKLQFYTMGRACFDCEFLMLPPLMLLALSL